ncbi:MAG TPA: ABC transporter permease subunit [Jiangellaceae bacterium]|nr:ABC transporter permease subunit [Jiangellaceae bacterium]
MNATTGAEPMQAVTGTSRVGSLTASLRAELLRLRKWPAVWILVGAWFALNLTFAYVFNYIAYATGAGNFSTGDATEGLLADLMPEAIPRIFTDGMPIFGGAIMMILGALVAGSGYGWGTWKTALTQGPSRLATFGGTVVALAFVVVAVIAANFAVDLGASTLIAAVESQPLVWPGLGDVAQALGGGLLIFSMWTAAGVLIGVLTRNPALAVGLGLVWSLVVENLLRGVAGLIDGLEYVTNVLPGTAAGSMAGALGATAEGSADGAPGVLTVLSGSESALLLVGYTVVFLVVAAVTMRRRDLA